MALSFPRPDPASPASIADATFSTARRGYDQREVRETLQEVAAELGRLIERERTLQRELRAAREERVPPSEVLDDETVTRLVGEETLRVLQTARESAAQIKARAEESAARLVREATEEADRIRAEAEVEAARLRSDASADAEAELALAKQQGREMVNEARAYRERVLSELGRRRDAARQQIEQLVSGRDRLLQVFERARLVAVDVVSDLEPLGEPDEYVNLSPTTGPVPMMVPRPDPASPPAEPEAVEPEPEAAEPEPEAVEPEPEPEAVEPEPEPEVVEPEAVEPEPEPEVVEPEAVESEPVESEAVEPESPAARAESDNVVSLFERLRAETAAPPSDAGPGASPQAEPAAAAAAEPEQTVADGDVAADASDEVETVFRRRDAELVPLITAAARKLKRVLADEQNDVLDTLRGKQPVVSLDALVLPADQHTGRFAAAIETELAAAARAGAELVVVDPDAPPTIDPDRLAPVHELIGSGLVRPLRDRLERAVADGDGANDEIARRVRAVYREWKTTHIDEQLDDVLRLAHGVGVLAGVPAGTPMCWAVDPDGPACPDAEDNALAGDVPAGDAYPTGHRVAPAHAGCRCLITPAGN